MNLLKPRKIFFLILLVVVSFTLSVVKFISGGGRTSQAQAQSCWTPTAVSGGCSTGGYPDACVSSGSGTSGTAAVGCGCVGCH